MVNDKLEMADTEHGKAKSLTSHKQRQLLPVCLSVLLTLSPSACLPFLLPKQKDALEAAGQLLRIFIQPLWQQEISQLQLQLLLKLTKALKNKQTAIEQLEGSLRGRRGERCSRDAAESQLQRATCYCCCCCCCLLGLAVAASQLCSAFSLPVPVALCEKSF